MEHRGSSVRSPAPAAGRMRSIRSRTFCNARSRAGTGCSLRRRCSHWCTPCSSRSASRSLPRSMLTEARPPATGTAADGRRCAGAPIRRSSRPSQLARGLDETDACLMGALRIHGASTAKVNLQAEWDRSGRRLSKSRRPASERFKRTVDELPLHASREGLSCRARQAECRPLATTILRTIRSPWFAPATLPAPAAAGELYFGDAAPRHLFSDTRRHHRALHGSVHLALSRVFSPARISISRAAANRWSWTYRHRLGRWRPPWSMWCPHSAGSGRPTPT